MFNFLRRRQEISRTNPGFEETERRTPKLGYLLLLIMAVAGIIFGWMALDDLSRIPSRPTPLSYCSNRYGSYQRTFIQQSRLATRVYDYDYIYNSSTPCSFIDLEQKHNIPALIEKRAPFAAKLQELNAASSNFSNQILNARRQRENIERQYGLGLEEKQANVPQIFPTPAIQQQILALRSNEAALQKLLTPFETEKQPLVIKLKEIDGELTEAYKPVFAEYNRRLRFYEFKVFLLQFGLILPLFLLALWAYFKLHSKNSPYTIIFTAILAVIGILVLRIILFWFWGLFLERVLEILVEWWAKFKILRSLIFYCGMILSFLIFGGAVYYLQKKIFDPRRVAIRRFRAKQCPHCQTNLDLASLYCPNCGRPIKEKCKHCGK